jgi:hypothetical protein
MSGDDPKRCRKPGKMGGRRPFGELALLAPPEIRMGTYVDTTQEPNITDLVHLVRHAI